MNVFRRRFEPSFNVPDRAIAAALSVALILLSVWSLAPSLGSSQDSVEPTPFPAAGRAYVEGVLGMATNASPFGARTAADRSLVALLFRGLVRLGPGNTIAGDLASRWDVDDDGQTWTFHLRPDQHWQDGEPITADDVVFTIDVLGDPTFTGPGAESWREVEATAVDPLTVSLRLSTPLGGFLQAATQPIAPAHLLAGVPVEDLADDPFGLHPVGSGPYRLLVLGADRATLVAVPPSEQFIDLGDTGDGPVFERPRPTDSLATSPPTPKPDVAVPYIQRIEFRYFHDLQSLAAAWSAGQLDAVSGFQPEDLASLEAAAPAGEFRVVRYPSSTLLAAALDLRAARQEFQDPAVRRALLESINRDVLVRDVLAGLGTRADSLIPPSSPMFDPSKSPVVPFDRAAARKALADAGWKEGEISWTPKNADKPIVIELLSPEESANPVAYGVAERVVDAWQSLGLSVRHIPLPGSELIGERLSQGNFQVAVIPLAIGLDPDLYPLLASSQTRTGGSNVVGLQDPALDKLLLAARTPVSEEERATAYAALQERLAARMYLLPLAFRDEAVLFRDTVVGPTSRPVSGSWDRWWDVLTWRLADG
ncbi:MAG TPA: ABC transporter substrate-binding protein [Candidatus Binatia bacterium]|nr:ABC transporter substrate-binding protein [Candidatus Binatia bacterium]